MHDYCQAYAGRRISGHERKSESGRWRTAIPSCQSLSGTALLCRKPQESTSAVESAAAAKFDLSIVARSRRCRDAGCGRRLRCGQGTHAGLGSQARPLDEGFVASRRGQSGPDGSMQ